MQVYSPQASFYRETSAQNAVNIFPYLREQVEAIQALREMERDLGRISNHGRRILAQGGSKTRKVGTIPMHILMECIANYGYEFLHSQALQEKFLKANPEWSYIYGK